MNPPPLLDLRPPMSYATGHAAHATHFAGLNGEHGLSCRLHELPASAVSPVLTVIAPSAAEAAAAVELLHQRGYTARALEPETESHAHTVLGVSSRALWRPSPLLARELSRVERVLRAQPRTALDVGAGSGRDSAYLAARGFRVMAVERDPALVRKAAHFGQREMRKGGAVHAVARTLGAHLADDRAWLRKHAASLLLVVRFLRRGVLELLHEGVAKGGIVLYEHFLVGCEALGGPNKRGQLLEMGELQTVFSAERGFHVLHDAAELLPDGRPVVRFVAQRGHC